MARKRDLMNKYHFVIDEINKSKKLENTFLARYKNYPPHLSDIIIILGGDGFMLQSLKKYKKFNKPFYGINRGTFGFLMNKFKTYDVKKFTSIAKIISISPLKMIVKTKNGKTNSNIAINEVSLLRQTRQASSLQVLKNSVASQ